MRDQLAQILGERVVVVARRRLAGLTETSAVISDDTLAGIQEYWNLLLPGSSVEWVSGGLGLLGFLCHGLHSRGRCCLSFPCRQ